MYLKIIIFLLMVYENVTKETDLPKSCDTICYQNVNKTYTHLSEMVEIFNSTVTKAKFPNLIDLENLRKILMNLHEVKNSAAVIDSNLKKGIPKLQICLRNYATNKNSTDYLRGLLNNASNNSSNSSGNIEEITLKLYEIYNRYSKFDNETCRESARNYETLLKDVELISKLFENDMLNFSNFTRNSINLNEDTNQASIQTLKNRKQLDSLEIPSHLLDKYAEDVMNTLDALIKLLLQNKNNLEDLLKNLSANEHDLIYQILKKMFESAQQDVSKVNKEVEMYEKEIKEALHAIGLKEFSPNDLTDVIKEIGLALDKLEKLLTTLEAELKSAEEQGKEVTKFQVDLEKNKFPVIDNATRILQEYIEILDVLPQTDEQIAKIKFEIWKNQETLKLIKQKEALRREIAELEMIAKEMEDSTKCPNNIGFEN